MDVLRATGFWSYVQADDVEGRITRLAHAISAEYESITASKLDLFLDRDSLEWGDAWKERIVAAIAGTTFFIPIVTPRYFESDQCRTELVQFTTKARNLGLEELLLPVLYIDVEELHEQRPGDDAVRLIKDTQWVDWRELRLEEPQSSAVLKGISAMAKRLAAISKRVSAVPDTGSELDRATGEDEEPPGRLDLLAQGEAALPEMERAIDALSQELNDIASLAEAKTAEFAASDARSGGFAGRVRVAKELARELEPHAERIQEIGRDYATALLAIDPAIQTLLSSMEDGTFGEGSSLTGEERIEALGFIEGVRSLTEGSREGMEGLRQFLASLEAVAGMSRDIRRPAAKIKNGLQGMVDGHAIIEQWGERAAVVEEHLKAEDVEEPLMDDQG